MSRDLHSRQPLGDELQTAAALMVVVGSWHAPSQLPALGVGGLPAQLAVQLCRTQGVQPRAHQGRVWPHACPDDACNALQHLHMRSLC